jgi:hypothetical protein
MNKSVPVTEHVLSTALEESTTKFSGVVFDNDFTRNADTMAYILFRQTRGSAIQFGTGSSGSVGALV